MSEIDEIDAQIAVLQQKRKILKLAELNAKRTPYIKRWGIEAFNVLEKVSGFGEVKLNKLFTYDSMTTDQLLMEFPLLKKVSLNDLKLIVAAVNRTS